MKGLAKILSVLLILSACFGVYKSAAGIKDIASSKEYWEDQGAEARDNFAKLDDGIDQLSENEQAYIDGVDQVAQGEKDLAKGKADLAAGKAQLAQGKQDLAAGEKKLAAGKNAVAAGEKKLAAGRKEVAAGEKQVTEGKAALAALQPLLTSIQQYQALYKANGIESKYATALSDSSAIKNQINTYANTLVQTGQMLGEEGASLVTAGNGLLANLNGLATDPTAKSAPVAAFAQRANAQNSATDIGFNPILKQVSAGLDSKLTEINAGLSQIEAGIPQIEAGISQLSAGISQLEQIPEDMRTAEQTAQLQQYKAQKAGYEQQLAGLQQQKTELTQTKGQLTALKSSADNLVNAINGWLANDYAPIAPAQQQQLSALGGGIVSALISNGLVTGDQAAQLKAYDSAQKITASGAPEVLVTLNGVFSQVNATVDQKKQELAAGEKKLAAGKAELAKGEKDLAAGKAEVAKGEKDLAAGKAQLAQGEKDVAAGEVKVADGEAQLADGKAQLAQYEDGEAQLIDGLKTALATKGYTGVETIKARLGDKFSFMKGNKKNVNLSAASDVVKAGRDFLGDTEVKVTGELMPKLYGNIAVIIASILALIGGLLGLKGKHKGAGIVGGLAAVSAGIGAAFIAKAGTEMAEIAGSSLLGTSLYIGAFVLLAVGVVHAIVNLATKKEA